MRNNATPGPRSSSFAARMLVGLIAGAALSSTFVPAASAAPVSQKTSQSSAFVAGAASVDDGDVTCQGPGTAPQGTVLKYTKPTGQDVPVTGEFGTSGDLQATVRGANIRVSALDNAAVDAWTLAVDGTTSTATAVRTADKTGDLYFDVVASSGEHALTLQGLDNNGDPVTDTAQSVTVTTEAPAPSQVEQICSEYRGTSKYDPAYQLAWGSGTHMELDPSFTYNLTGYQVSNGDNSGPGTGEVTMSNLDVPGALVHLTPGRWSFHIEAFNADGTGFRSIQPTWPTSRTFEIDVAPAPRPVENASVDVDGDKVTVSWDATQTDPDRKAKSWRVGTDLNGDGYATDGMFAQGIEEKEVLVSELPEGTLRASVTFDKLWDGDRIFRIFAMQPGVRDYAPIFSDPVNVTAHITDSGYLSPVTDLEATSAGEDRKTTLTWDTSHDPINTFYNVDVIHDATDELVTHQMVNHAPVEIGLPDDAPEGWYRVKVTRINPDNGNDSMFIQGAEFQLELPNSLPTAVDDEKTVVENSVNNEFADLTANDTDPDFPRDTLYLIDAGGASHGSVGYSNGVVTYTPNAGFVGDDTFSYRIADLGPDGGYRHYGEFVTGTVTVHVVEAVGDNPPVENPPVVDTPVVTPPVTTPPVVTPPVTTPPVVTPVIPTPGKPVVNQDGSKTYVGADGTPTKVYGAIGDFYSQAEGDSGTLGAPIGEEFGIKAGGRVQRFEGGLVYWTPQTGAQEVHGAIRDRFGKDGWENSQLGYPTTSETKTPDEVGRFNHFQGGSIYWTPSTGAQVVKGAIKDRWSQIGWEKSQLGYPTGEEFAIKDGGRVQRFQTGLVYWTPQTGANEVHGAFQGTFASQGWENGSLGYPKTGEYTVNGKVRQDFQGGTLEWDPKTGKVTRR